LSEQNINTNITATANFSGLTSQLQAVTAELIKLQTTTVGLNKNLQNQIGVMNRSFADSMTSTGQFSKHFVTLTSDVEKFGKNLDSGRLKLSQYYNTWQGHVKNSNTLIKDLAKQQVMLENAIIQPLGKNAQGLMQYNVMVQRGLDTTKEKMSLLRQEQAIVNKVMQDGANQLINWGKNTQWAGRQLTVGLTVPIAAFGVAASKAFREADQELVRLTKVYGGLTAVSSAELAKVRKDISETAKELASSMGASYKETIGLAADIAATGKEGVDLIAATKETTRLAVLGEVDRQEAMKATLAIQSAFKQNTDELTKSIDFLNSVENQTSTSLADLVEAIPKAGPVVQAMGGSIKDVALYLTAMREGGINASEGANALKSALASLVNPTKVAKEMFNGFGIDLSGIVTKNAGNLTETILQLQSALDTLNPLQKQQAIEQLFGKFQFSRMNALFANLGKEGSQTLKVLDLMKASSSQLADISARELAQVTESASGRYKRALESVKADLAGVGESFLKINTYVLQAIDGIVKFVNHLPGPIKSVLTFVGGLTALAGPLIMLTGVLGNFLGYVIKGVFALKNMGKGKDGFKLLTPEIMAAAKAGNLLHDSFYSDAKATETLRDSVFSLAEAFNAVKVAALEAGVATNKVISTAQGNVIISPSSRAINGERVANKNSPFIGAPYTRDMVHTNPTASKSAEARAAETIFSTVPGPKPVNQKVSNNPQIYMNNDLPKINGITSVNGVSTGIVAAEAAKWHAMTAAIATQSEAEIAKLKTEVAATGTVTSELSDAYQQMLPAMSELTTLAAQDAEMIVKELQAGTLTVEAARAKIFQLNATVEAMMAETATQIATGMGRNINLTTVPLTSQPVVSAAGKSNMKELFHKTETSALADAIARNLGVRTSGGGYSIETTIPKRLNSGGKVGGVYNPNVHGAVVPGDTSINYDNTPARVPLGGFVLNQEASRNNPELVERAKNGYNAGGQIDALLTPGETVVDPRTYQENRSAYDMANSSRKRISFRNAGGLLGGQVVPRRLNYGEVNSDAQLKYYTEFHTSKDWNPYARAGAIANDAEALARNGVPYKEAVREATKWFDDRWARTLAENGGEFSQAKFTEITQGSYKNFEKELRKKYTLKKSLSKDWNKRTGSGAAPTRKDWQYTSGGIDINLRKDILTEMLDDKNISSSAVSRLIKESGVATLHRAHAVPGVENKLSGFNYLGQAVLQPGEINTLAKDLNHYGIHPNAFSLDVNENKKSMNTVAKKLGYLDHEDMVKSLSSRQSAQARPPRRWAVRNGMTAIMERLVKSSPADFRAYMARPMIANRLAMNSGGEIGGVVTSGKKNYGITIGERGFPLFKGRYKSPLMLHPEQVKLQEKRTAERLAKAPKDAEGRIWQTPLELAYIREGKMSMGKNPMPKSYYQDLSNDDPAHGALQIGRYRPPIHVRNQYVGEQIRYSSPTNWRGREGISSPAFEVGTLETRAKSALYKYMQGDYSAIDDPAVQKYLSTLRTKFTGTLHRGVRHTSSLPPVIRDLIQQGKWAELVGKEFIMRRSSWSTNKDTAEGFGQLQLIANVKNRNAVPASQIFPDLTFQSAQGPVPVNESEVYMGGKFRVVGAEKNKLRLQAIYDAAREKGGPVNKSRPYLVGEKGPELFVPNANGKIVPGYNMGGIIKQLLVMAGVGQASSMVGQKVGGVGGEAISTIGQLLPFLMMGNAGMGSGSKLSSKLPSSWNQAAFVESKGGSSLASSLGGNTKMLSAYGAKMTQLATTGGKFGSTIGKLALGMSRFNLALGVGTTAAVVAWKAWKNHNEHLRVGALQYGLTAEAAKKAGLKFTDYNQKMKDAVSTIKDLNEKNQLIYESMTQSDTPINLTIKQYKALKKEVQSTYADQIKLINQTKDSKSINKVALDLKTQLIAAGMSAEEATKKIYTMFKLSNKASSAVAATVGNTRFNQISDPQTAAVAAVGGYKSASKEGGVEGANAVNTALTAIDTGIQDSIERSKKAAMADKTGNTKVLTQYEAELKMINRINNSKKDGTKITKDTIDQLAKENPAIREIATEQDTVVSLWQKMDLATKGYSGNLSELGSEAVATLSKIAQAISNATIAANKEGLLKDQYNLLDKLTAQRDKLLKAAKGQSVQQQINDRDALAALNKQIDKNNKLADARKKALDAAKQDADLARAIEKKKLEIQSAIASGNDTQAQQAQLDMEGLLKQQQYESQVKAIDKSVEDANAPLLKQIEAIQNKQQKLADGAALAGEGLSKLNDKIATQKDKIDAVNTAMTSFRLNAAAAGKSLEEWAKDPDGMKQATAITNAAKNAGVKTTAGQNSVTYTPGIGPVVNKVTNSQAGLDLLKTTQAAVEKGLSAQNMEVQNSGDIYINGSKQTVQKNVDAGGKALKTITAKIETTGYSANTVGKGSLMAAGVPLIKGAMFLDSAGKKWVVGDQSDRMGMNFHVTQKAGYGLMNIDPKKPTIVGDRGPEMIFGNMVIPNMAKVPFAGPRYDVAKASMKMKDMGMSSSNGTYNVTQNIYASDGMDVEALANMVVKQTKLAIGQEAKVNAKMVGVKRTI
jgi:TP901 family phage tail tape measure protein